MRQNASTGAGSNAAKPKAVIAAEDNILSIEAEEEAGKIGKEGVEAESQILMG